MLNEVYSGRKALWENWDGCRNVVFMTGFAHDITKTDQVYSFKLKQSIYQDEYFQVVIKKGAYHPSDLIQNAPIKIIARIKQDPSLEYPSLIMYPLKIARPMFNEIPQDTSPINADGTINNFIDFAALEELNKGVLQRKLKAFINRVQVAGFVYAKKILDPQTMLLLLWNGEHRLLPVCIVGERYVKIARTVKQFMPIRVDGRLSFRSLDGKPQVCVVTKELRIAVSGNDIPKTEPEWLKQAVLKFFESSQPPIIEEKEELIIVDEALHE